MDTETPAGHLASPPAPFSPVQPASPASPESEAEPAHKRQRTDEQPAGQPAAADPWSELADNLFRAAQDLGLQLDMDSVADAVQQMQLAAGELRPLQA